MPLGKAISFIFFLFCFILICRLGRFSLFHCIWWSPMLLASLKLENQVLSTAMLRIVDQSWMFLILKDIISVSIKIKPGQSDFNFSLQQIFCTEFWELGKTTKKEENKAYVRKIEYNEWLLLCNRSHQGFNHEKKRHLFIEVRLCALTFPKSCIGGNLVP